MSTEIFLHLLDADTNEFCFLAYAEQSDLKGAKQFQGSLEQLREILSRLNQDGFGISVCINETDGQGRKRQNIVRVRAICQDDDKGYKGDFPLEPSLIVQTSPGRQHRYWLVADHWPTDEEGEADFRSVMQTLVDCYGADPQATDLSRVMRLPGFHHSKSERHLVAIVGGNAKHYTRKEILEHFSPKELYGTAEKIDAESAISEVEDTITDDELARIADALSHIAPEDRDNWLTVGMALHHYTKGAENGYEIWDEWSKTTKAKNYSEKKQKSAWDGFSEDRRNPKTIASLYRLARKNGWTDIPPLAALPEHRINISRKDGDLVFKTLADIRKQFKKFGHNPSEQHFGGLEQIAGVIQAMAENDPVLHRHFHISFLPPGTGKTTTVAAAIRNLVVLQDYKEIGVIIFLFRVEEIAKLAQAMGLSDQDYSVVVSDNYLEGKLGNPEKTMARVLFTTQQMLESRLRWHGAFESIPDFHWNGSPRQVRIWDEAILPAQPITLNYYGISSLLKIAGHEGNAGFADDLDSIHKLLGEAKSGHIVRLPDVSVHGITMGDMRSWYEDNEDKACCEALFGMSGKEVRVRKDVRNTALDYENFLPDDLGPMLVLDASGQFRKVYQFWQQNREDLIALPSPPKNYNGLTIHHWNRGMGRKSRKDEGEKFVEGAVKAIRSIPQDEHILVIYHNRKSQKEPDWEREIRSHLLQSDNVHFCNWGKHTATNDYHQCRHVILLGVLQYSASAYEAIARGAKGLNVKDKLSDTDLQATRLGEIAHHIFQAACRGMVRKSEGESCPSGCNLYVIGSDHAGVGIPRDLLSQIFPGATIKDWRPVINLKGRAKELWDLLQGMPSGTPIEKEDLRQKLGMNHVQQLNQLLKHPDLRATIEEEGSRLEDGRGTVTLHRAPQWKRDLDKLYPF
jgi:hypothetical protein